jgi:repressor LexA
MQEIGDYMGLTKVTVFEHVGALERKGLLERGEKHKARSLQVSSDFEFPEDESVSLPLVGRIAAGLPIEAIENRESLDLGAMFDETDETFVLEVNGESMIDEQIRDGEATLKTFYKESGRVRLQPANENFEPIYPNEISIQGVVIGVVRRV